MTTKLDRGRPPSSVEDRRRECAAVWAFDQLAPDLGAEKAFERVAVSLRGRRSFEDRENGHRGRMGLTAQGMKDRRKRMLKSDKRGFLYTDLLIPPEIEELPTGEARAMAMLQLLQDDNFVPEQLTEWFRAPGPKVVIFGGPKEVVI